MRQTCGSKPTLVNLFNDPKTISYIYKSSKSTKEEELLTPHKHQLLRINHSCIMTLLYYLVLTQFKAKILKLQFHLMLKLLKSHKISSHRFKIIE